MMRTEFFDCPASSFAATSALTWHAYRSSTPGTKAR